LVAEPGTRPRADDVAETVAGHLAPFKRPSEYRLVSHLPRTSVGRLDRAAVRRDCAEADGLDPAEGSAGMPGPGDDGVDERPMALVSEPASAAGRGEMASGGHDIDDGIDASATPS